MKIHYLEDGASAYVFGAKDETEARDCAYQAEYFDRDDHVNVEVRVVPPGEIIKIDCACNGHVIEHTAEEWCWIYDGLVSAPAIICQSDY